MPKRYGKRRGTEETMRDRKRIPKLMMLVMSYWYMNPDLRLFQMLLSLQYELEKYFPECGGDFFYVEDDKMFEALKAIVDGGNK
jgi:uncharacterized protein YihD (DUF1040 family)